MSKPVDQLDPAREWAAWVPTKDDPWTAKWASHLYRRAAFGPTRDELRSAFEAGPDATLVRLLAGPKEPVERPRVVYGLPPIDPMTNMPDPTSQAVRLRAGWLGRMIDGVEPAREKLALFWHNHFATSVKKVADGYLMERQGELLFKHAAGHFRSMLRDISRDPAMLVYLDSNQNLKGKPNENYAREVMELFTLGVGNYSEADVRDAARAFTGWHTVDGKYAFVRGQHDEEAKTVLGQSGKWGGDDVLRILLEQPACAKFLVRKLYRYYLNETLEVSDAFLAPVADAFRKSDYDIAVPVRLMLRSRHFYSPHAYKQKVKSPVEYAINVVRAVGVNVTGRVAVNPFALLGVLELMGQILYAPPNVKGWEGGTAWLNTATVLARHNFAHALVHMTGELTEYAKKFNLQTFYAAVDPLAFVRRLDLDTSAKVIDFYADLLLPGDLRPEARTKLIAHVGDAAPGSEAFIKKCRDALYVLLTLPEYQLN